MSQAKTSRAQILVVEDNETQRKAVVKLLLLEDYRVDSVATGEEGLELLEEDFYDVVLLDLDLPGIHGLKVLCAGPSLQVDTQFIVLTGAASIDDAVEAMKGGAWDFLTKPFSAQRLLVTIGRALETGRLRREVAELRRIAGEGGVGRILGRSPAIRRVLDLIQKVAPTQATVLITGATGTGKELVARAVHDLSDRSSQRFVGINCSALTESLLESELFGHVKGAFTGAVHAKRGLFEEASGGTLFLDEIGDVSGATQVKLLRVLQERVITPVGGNSEVAVDFRLVTATNRDLKARVASGEFREDLYYRLSIFPIEVPPLKKRREDIPLLADSFRLRFADQNGLAAAPELPASTMSDLMAYDWPGNIRELENFVERAVIMHTGGPIQFDAPSSEPTDPGVRDVLLQAREDCWDLERVERTYILRVLEDHGWSQTRSAEVLGVNRSTLYRKLTRYREEGHLPGNRADTMVDGPAD